MTNNQKPKPNGMLKLFKDARIAASPLLAIQTPDPAATVRSIANSFNGKPPAVFEWDAARGVRAVFSDHQAALVATFGTDTAMLRRADEVLELAVKMPDDAVLFMHNAHRYIEDNAASAPTIQAASNLREYFKYNGRMLILLGPFFRLPPELANDVLVLDEPLPDADELRGIAANLYLADGTPENQPTPATEDDMRRIVDATSGLAAFSAEQAMAMSLRKTGMDLSALWERKRQMIEDTDGLSVHRGGNKFDGLGGLDNIKAYFRMLLNKGYRVIAFIDEIEKYINPEGDLSGVSKDQLGQKLTFMQDNNVDGVMLLGPPGTGKSEICKSLGNEMGCPVVIFDLGAMTGSLVGESQLKIRRAFKVLKAIGGDKILFVATCNSIGQMPPELRRRYTKGTFFMDLPDKTERAAIWKIYRKKFGIADTDKTPPDEGWTGAEIRVCCDNASSFKCTLMDAAQFIVPVAKSAQDKIERLRSEASGRYISASKPGLYQMPTTALEPAAAGTGYRKVRL
jgi:hypothetical protein